MNNQKYTSVSLIAIGDVAAAAIIAAATSARNINVNNVDYPISLHMDYMQTEHGIGVAEAPKAYLGHVASLIGNPANLCVFVVNEYAAPDLINYRHWYSNINFLTREKPNVVVIKVPRFTEDGQQSQDEMVKNVIINELLQANESEIDVSDDAGPLDVVPAPIVPVYDEAGKVDPSIPRKVFVVIGNTANYFFQTIRMDAVSGAISDMRFNHERDDYYLVPELTEENCDQELSNINSEIVKRHHQSNQYIFIVQDPMAFSESVKDCVRAIELATKVRSSVLLIPEKLYSENKGSNGVLVEELRCILRAMEETIESVSKANEEKVEPIAFPKSLNEQPFRKQHLQSVIASMMAGIPVASHNVVIAPRQIVIALGSVANYIIADVTQTFGLPNSKEWLLDPSQDIILHLVTPSDDDQERLAWIVEQFYNENVEVLLVYDKHTKFQPVDVSSKIRSKLSKLTKENYTFIAVESSFKKAKKYEKDDFNRIVNEIRGMHERTEQRKQLQSEIIAMHQPEKEETIMSNKDQKDNKEGIKLNEQILAMLTEMFAPIKKQLDVTNRNLQGVASVVTQLQRIQHHGAVYGPGAVHPTRHQGFGNHAEGMFAPIGSGNHTHRHDFFSVPVAGMTDPMTWLEPERQQNAKQAPDGGREYPNPPHPSSGRPLGSQQFGSPMFGDREQYGHMPFRCHAGIPAGLVRSVHVNQKTVTPHPIAATQILLVIPENAGANMIFEALRAGYQEGSFEHLSKYVVITISSFEDFMHDRFLGFGTVCFVTPDVLEAEGLSAFKLQQNLDAIRNKTKVRNITIKQFMSYLVGLEQGWATGRKYPLTDA